MLKTGRGRLAVHINALLFLVGGSLAQVQYFNVIQIAYIKLKDTNNTFAGKIISLFFQHVHHEKQPPTD